MKKTPANAAPCPPNGLPRAAWFRDLAAATDVPEPEPERERARKTAEDIERRELDRLPLHRLMTE